MFVQVSQRLEFRQEFEQHVGHDLRRPVQELWPPTIAANFLRAALRAARGTPRGVACNRQEEAAL